VAFPELGEGSPETREVSEHLALPEPVGDHSGASFQLNIAGEICLAHDDNEDEDENDNDNQ
jgi:hypothetical protein